MAFFKRTDCGRLYILKITFPDGFVVFKVGMTHSDRSANRMMEILRSWFMQYRFVPHTELKLDRETPNPEKLEHLAHKALKEYQWVPDRKVDGGSEMFSGLDELRLVHFLKHIDVGQDADNLHLLGKLLANNDD